MADEGTTGQAAQRGEAFAQMAKSLPPGIITIVGALFIFLGVILPWISGEYTYPGHLGLMMPQGAALFLVAVLSIAVLLLQRSGAAGAWSQVSILLSFVAIVLVFQALANISNWHLSIGAGYWLSMIGVLILAVGNALQFFGVSRG